MTKFGQGVEDRATTLAFEEKFRYQLVHVFDTNLKIVRRLGVVDNITKQQTMVL